MFPLKLTLINTFLFLFIVFAELNTFGNELIDAKVFARDKKIWISGVNGERAKQLIKAEIRQLYGVSSNGRVIYAVPAADNKGKDNVLLYQIGKGPKQIMQVEPGTNITVSLDGSKLVFSVYRKGGTMLDLQSNKQSPIPFSPFEDKYRRATLKTYSKIDGDWNWHWDSNFTWSADGNLMAFRRCSGDRDKPACLTVLLDMKSNKRPVVVAEDLAVESQTIQNHVPAGFVGSKMLLWTQADLYSYDLSSKTSSFVAADAWSSAISPDGKSVAFVSGANTKEGANLWSIKLASGDIVRLTNFKNVDINGSSIRWSLDSKVIYFGWQTADLKNEPAWSINSDGSNLKEIKEIGPEEYMIRIPAVFFKSR